MKKLLTGLGIFCLSLGLTGCSASGFGSVLLVLLALALLALAGLRTWSVIQYNSRPTKRGQRRRRKNIDPATLAMFGIGAVLLLVALLVGSCDGAQPQKPEETKKPAAQTQQEKEKRTISIHAEMAEHSDPANWGIRWEIFENGQIAHRYQRQETISFGYPEDYFALPGVAAFRGNNFRDNAAYGTADITEQKISLSWTADSTELPGGRWRGSGWTGQPLVVKWDNATKNIMNLYQNKKDKDGLVEVIYATLDGHIYFLDLEDGTPTRDAINVGMCFKGSGSLDPRGYPLMYVGSGDDDGTRRPRMYVISLIDGRILYEYGHQESLSYRKDNDNWCAFDSSPLVDAETDTLIWPGESGVLYTIKLNTNYDKAAGTLSISPDQPVCTRYLSDRSSGENYWVGYEASVNIVDHYLYVSENGGLFYCVDLNTMELVWAQDTKDDSNSSPVFQLVSEDEAYIYTAPSLHWTQDANAQGSISIYKINALTGEIVWQKPYSVYTVSGVSGGVQSTALLGREGTDLEGLVIYTVARTPRKDSGVMVALDTKTGDVVWSMDMTAYTWSSPVALYTKDNKGYIVVCDSAGQAMLLGADGKLCSKVGLGGLVEASPVAYENMLVVGTKDEKICGLRVD